MRRTPQSSSAADLTRQTQSNMLNITHDGHVAHWDALVARACGAHMHLLLVLPSSIACAALAKQVMHSNHAVHADTHLVWETGPPAAAILLLGHAMC